MTNKRPNLHQLNYLRVTRSGMSVELLGQSNTLMRGDIIVAGKMLHPFLASEVS
jgi:hypothetical protein